VSLLHIGSISPRERPRANGNFLFTSFWDVVLCYLLFVFGESRLVVLERVKDWVSGTNGRGLTFEMRTGVLFCRFLGDLVLKPFGHVGFGNGINVGKADDCCKTLEACQAENLLSLDSPCLIYLLASLPSLLEWALLVLFMHTPFILEHLMCS
jgi:hypothetical protein